MEKAEKHARIKQHQQSIKAFEAALRNFESGAVTPRQGEVHANKLAIMRRKRALGVLQREPIEAALAA